MGYTTFALRQKQIRAVLSQQIRRRSPAYAEAREARREALHEHLRYIRMIGWAEIDGELRRHFAKDDLRWYELFADDVEGLFPGIEPDLSVHRDHAFLIPCGNRLPFRTRAEVFYFKEKREEI